MGMGSLDLPTPCYRYMQVFSDVRKAMEVLKQVLNANFQDKPGECILGEIEASDVESMATADENPLIQISIPQYVAERVWTEGKELALQDSNMFSLAALMSLVGEK